jgi:hypothetical protein
MSTKTTARTDKFKRKRFTQDQREIVWRQFYGDRLEALCVCCGFRTVRPSTSHLAHITALASDGLNEIENIVPICQSCNLATGTKPAEKHQRESHPKQPSISSRRGKPDGSGPILSRAWNLPRRNADFVGRKDLLKALKEALAKGGKTALTHAIAGTGGVGKTSLALEYAWRHAVEANEYSLAWWVRAERPETRSEDFTRLGIALSLRLDPRHPEEAVRDWLEANAG